ncbi:MAG: metal ABC transporter permease, partial [Ruminiclostridium sp.]|nr:metal ABC transporter permease [Ruminiclostridium sp.]
QNAKINGDAAIAMISVGSLAVGYMMMNLFPSSANVTGDVCTTLFGTIITLQETDVIVCIVMSVIVIAAFLLFYHKIFAVTFDENFMKAAGVKAGAYNLIIAIITALIIVLAMNLVGSLLISALIIFPALSAMRVFRSFRSVIICSAVISMICAFTGIFTSIMTGTPVGSTIVVTDIIVFFIFCIISLFARRKTN